MRSLSYLLDKPVGYEGAPDLFCLDLYKDFDLYRRIALTEPTMVHEENYQEEMQRSEGVSSDAKESHM